MKNKVLYTPEEVAEVLKLSKYTVYEMVKRGELKALKIGRGIRISQDNLNEYFEMSANSKNIFIADVKSDGISTFVEISGIKIFLSQNESVRSKLYIAPEIIVIAMEDIKCSARNKLNSKIYDIHVEKDKVTLTLEIAGSEPKMYLDALITTQSLNDLKLKKGDEVFALFKTMSIKVMPMVQN